jgi:NTE family protein
VVLSGGGTRGAYEVGVLRGIVEVLELTPSDPSPFQIFAGTSVGALNAAYLASHAHRGDLGIDGLVDAWASLRLHRHARVDRLGFTRRALLDVRPLAQLVRESVDWNRLHQNAAEGVIDSLVVAALQVRTGRTAMFTQLSPTCEFTPSRDPNRVSVRTDITAEHVLASAAIPGVFPPRRVGRDLYYDGGLRFNTPIAPAVRCGADRLMVVSPLFNPMAKVTEGGSPEQDLDGGPGVLDGPPPLTFLAGKMFNALLLDSVAYDIQVLRRFNRFVRLLEDTMDDAGLAALRSATLAERGAVYRVVENLVISPSEDIGAIAVQLLREKRWSFARQGLTGLVLAALFRSEVPTDLLSYLMFDGQFAMRLIELGHRDALASADRVHAFFEEDD